MNIIKKLLIGLIFIPLFSIGQSINLNSQKERILTFNNVGLTWVQPTPSYTLYDIDLYYANHSTTYLDLPSHVPTSDSGVVHPSVLDMNIENGGSWNGYRYWMAYTPLPAVTPDNYEDPTVVTSNDLTLWNTPEGGTNPIYGGADIIFHADPNLYFENDSLYCTFISRKSSGTDIWVAIMSTGDGITWTNAKFVYNISTNNFISPSLIKDGSVYKLYLSNRVGSIPYTNSNVLIFESNNLYTSWAIADTISLDVTGTKLQESENFGYIDYIWHLEVRKISDKYIMSAYFRCNSLIYQGMYLGESENGVDFDMAKYSLMPIYQSTNSGIWDEGLYKFSVFPKYNENNYIDFGLLYSGWAGSNDVYPVYIGIANVSIPDIPIDIADSNTINISKYNVILDSAVNRLGDYVIGDKFDRIRTSGFSLDTSSSGYTYTYGTYNYFRTNNGYGYLVYDSPNPSFFIDSVLNYEWSMIFHTKEPSSNVWYILKYIDNDNYIYYNNDDGTIRTKISGTITIKKSVFIRQKNNDLDFITIQFLDDKATIMVNGCKYLDYTFQISDFTSEVEKNTFMASTKKGMMIRDKEWKMFSLTLKSL